MHLIIKIVSHPWSPLTWNRSFILSFDLKCLFVYHNIDVLEGFGLVFCRMSIKLDLYDCFLLIDLGKTVLVELLTD